MFKQLVRNSTVVNFLFLPFIFIFGGVYFIYTSIPEFDSSKSLLMEIFPKLFSNPSTNLIIYFTFLVLTVLVMIPFSVIYLHNVIGNTVSSFLIILFITVYVRIYSFSPSIISMFFCMLVFRNIFEIYHRERVFNFGFNSGFMIALATLIYFPACVFILIAWIGFSLLKSFNLRDFFIILIGFLIPFLIVHALFLINGNQIKLLDFLQKNLVFITPSETTIKQYLFLILLGIIGSWSLFKPLSSGILKKVVLRRYYQVFFSSVIIILAAFFFGIGNSGLLVFVFLPFSYTISISLASIRKSNWIEFFVFFLIVIQILFEVLV
jgi:hypothetical protein